MHLLSIASVCALTHQLFSFGGLQNRRENADHVLLLFFKKFHSVRVGCIWVKDLSSASSTPCAAACDLRLLFQPQKSLLQVNDMNTEGLQCMPFLNSWALLALEEDEVSLEPKPGSGVVTGGGLSQLQMLLMKFAKSSLARVCHCPLTGVPNCSM